MGSDSSRTELDEYAVQLIKYKARQLVGRAGFTKDDREDIEGDLTLDLLRRLRKFDPSRASFHTFVDRVVNHGVARLIERREAPMRDYRRCVSSLNDRIEDDEGECVERGDLVDQDTYLQSVGQTAMPLADRIALRVTLERVLATLTPEMRDLWARRAEGQTFTEISRETGIPRGTLPERMKQLQRLAEDAGLREYLEPS
jgi:RNA polymerase sigma-70 factor (ECF subfamily)